MSSVGKPGCRPSQLGSTPSVRLLLRGCDSVWAGVAHFFGPVEEGPRAGKHVDDPSRARGDTIIASTDEPAFVLDTPRDLRALSWLPRHPSVQYRATLLFGTAAQLRAVSRAAALQQRAA
eukprot:366166-Chlamydomonas_euryale.AAC.2